MSFGVSMASGLGISGAWAKGDNHGSKAAVADSEMEGCFSTTTGAMTDPAPIGTDGSATNGDGTGCAVASQPGTYMAGATPAMMGTDPSYFQAAIAYTFGDTTVAASWYSSEDFVEKGSEGTAMGIGVNHNLPKVGAQVYAAVQGYDAEDKMASTPIDTDETVFVVGTRVMF